jgi:REP element-mobilizing transposase RayT
MVLGSHVIFGTYGFWLPNDPRGSWSEFVGAWDLFRYGPATTTSERRSVAHRTHDVAGRLAAKEALNYRAVKFSGIQARAVGRGFVDYSQRSGLEVLACAILPDHVHLVLARHRLKVEQLVIQLKSAATRHLVAEEVHPFQHSPSKNGTLPKCFARGEWKVFLNDEEAISRAIPYVNANPEKEGLPPQRWSFVRASV